MPPREAALEAARASVAEGTGGDAISRRGTTPEDAMTTTVKQMLDEANAAFPRISGAQAKDTRVDRALPLLDVRDAPEVRDVAATKT